MNSSGFVEPGIMFAKNCRGARGLRRRVRIILPVGITVFMLWGSPTTATPSLLAISLKAPLVASPHVAITNVTLLLENDNANGAVFGGLATGAGGFGVVGFASAASSANFGVAGATNSDTGTGVFGLALSPTCPNVSPPVIPGQTCVGIIGQSSAITGVGVGVAGITQSLGGIGILGQSRGIGVSGIANDAAGAVALRGDTNSTTGTAVFANATATSGPAFGVIGQTNSPSGAGIVGQAFNGGLAGLFNNGPVQINGNLTVNGNSTVTGTKSAIVDTVSYGKRQLYAVESPQSWFEDFGSARLISGQTIVTLDPIFAQTVNTEDEYYIFLTPKGECKGLYVANQGATSFEVKELQRGKSSIAFDYRIVAKRKGYERDRLPAPTR